mgnify:CR=1 FL=1
MPKQQKGVFVERVHDFPPDFTQFRPNFLPAFAEHTACRLHTILWLGCQLDTSCDPKGSEQRCEEFLNSNGRFLSWGRPFFVLNQSKDG